MLDIAGNKGRATESPFGRPSEHCPLWRSITNGVRRLLRDRIPRVSGCHGEAGSEQENSHPHGESSGLRVATGPDSHMPGKTFCLAGGSVPETQPGLTRKITLWYARERGELCEVITTPDKPRSMPVISNPPRPRTGRRIRAYSKAEAWSTRGAAPGRQRQTPRGVRTRTSSRLAVSGGRGRGVRPKGD